MDFKNYLCFLLGFFFAAVPHCTPAQDQLVVDATRVVCCTIEDETGTPREVCAAAGDLARAAIKAGLDLHQSQDAGAD
jgi:hypothetical protein